MPIHNLGYRQWEGERVPPINRPLVITTTGVKRTMQSKWLRRLMFVSLLPVLALAVPFFLFEQAAVNPTGIGAAAHQVLRFMPFPPSPKREKLLNVDLQNATPETVNEVRHFVWSELLLMLFRYPQAWLMVVMVGIAAPPLISHDIRSRAFLIYFSRPINRWEYIFGKMGTVAFFLMMITTVPALLLYVTGVVLSPSLSIVFDTWDLPVRILLASVALIVPTTSVALMLSSLTTESRYAGFGWFALWILGNVTYGALGTFKMVSTKGQGTITWEALMSPYHTLGMVQSWIFKLETDSAPVVGAAILLVVVTVVSLVVLFRRVSKPMNV